MENKRRLIYDNDIINELVELADKRYGSQAGDADIKAINVINNIPTADAVEVVHGRWNMDEEMFAWNCSVCRSISLNGRRYSYCHNCGAKMDGKDIE